MQTCTQMPQSYYKQPQYTTNQAYNAYNYPYNAYNHSSSAYNAPYTAYNHTSNGYYPYGYNYDPATYAYAYDYYWHNGYANTYATTVPHAIEPLPIEEFALQNITNASHQPPQQQQDQILFCDSSSNIDTNHQDQTIVFSNDSMIFGADFTQSNNNDVAHQLNYTTQEVFYTLEENQIADLLSHELCKWTCVVDAGKINNKQDSATILKLMFQLCERHSCSKDDERMVILCAIIYTTKWADKNGGIRSDWVLEVLLIATHIAIKYMMEWQTKCIDTANFFNFVYANNGGARYCKNDIVDVEKRFLATLEFSLFISDEDLVRIKQDIEHVLIQTLLLL